MTKMSLGIDLGGTKINLGVISADAKIIQQISLSTPASGNQIIDTLDQAVRPLLAKYKITQVGLGTPGLVDFPNGKILGCTPNLADWEGRDLQQSFQDLWGVEMVVDNDANMAGFAEWKIGSGKGLSDLVMLTLGTGLGGVNVQKGQLARGHNQLGIGWGHMIVESSGRWCNCGQQGCLETYVSGKGIRKTYQLLGGDREMKGPDIFSMAEKGDELSQAALDQTLTFLAYGVVNILNAIAPQRIILGGGISAQGEKVLIKPLRRKVKGIMSMPFQFPETLHLAELGPDAGMIGAGLMAFEQIDGGINNDGNRSIRESTP